MSKMKVLRQDWFDRYVAAMLQIEPRLAPDDIWDEAWELYESRGHEDPAAVARQMARVDGAPKEEFILGVNTPAWMTPGAAVPPGWRFEHGRWRND